MHKKAFDANAFILVLAAVVIIAIAFVGISAVNSVRERTCKAELAEFQLYFSGLSESMRPGSAEKGSFGIPCGAERIYIMDTQDAPKAEWFSDYPLLKDSVAGNASKNIFLMKSNEVFHSFEAPNLQLKYPHFACLVPSNGKSTLSLEGLGRAVSLTPLCQQKTCDEIPESFDAKRIVRVFKESDKANCQGCIDTAIVPLAEEAKKAKLLYRHMDILRSYGYCDGKMSVHILFRPKAGVVLSDFRYFESIPKQCVENLKDVIDIREPENGVLRVGQDSIMMWGFSSLKKEQEVSYTLSKSPTDECVGLIEGSGIAREISRNGKVLESLPLTVNETRQVPELRVV